MLEFLIAPWSAALLNAFGRVLAWLGLSLFPLHPAGLRARAQRQTGLSDFGDPAYEAGLEAMCRSLREDADLTLVGRIALREHLTGALCTRLRLVETRRTRPEVFATPLVPPIIVVGLPRSGTTFLHRLLCLDDDVRVVPYWELRQPLIGPGPDHRRRDAARLIDRLKRLQPDIDVKHHFGVEEPEECVLLLDASFWSPTAFRLAPTYGYVDWLLEADPAHAYDTYRAHLQLLQADQPGRRLVLKNPDHTGFIGPLHTAVPEAMIVQTHRDPVPVLGSYNSLMTSIHGCVTAPDRDRSGLAGLRWWGEAVDRNMAQRTDTHRVFDLRYDDLLADPIGRVRALYEHFGLPFRPAFEARLAERLADRPQHAFGVHHYGLADYGLSEGQVRDRFAAYTAAFLA